METVHTSQTCARKREGGFASRGKEEDAPLLAFDMGATARWNTKKTGKGAGRRHRVLKERGGLHPKKEGGGAGVI